MSSLLRASDSFKPIVYWVDGGVLGKNPSPEGIYWSILREGGTPIRKRSEEYHTNNDAEWCALKEALCHARDLGDKGDVEVRSDSLLVVNQFNGVWRATVERHARMKHECRSIAASLPGRVLVIWNPRKESVARLGH